MPKSKVRKKSVYTPPAEALGATKVRVAGPSRHAVDAARETAAEQVHDPEPFEEAEDFDQRGQ